MPADFARSTTVIIAELESEYLPNVGDECVIPAKDSKVAFFRVKDRMFDFRKSPLLVTLSCKEKPKNVEYLALIRGVIEDDYSYFSPGITD